MSATAYTVPEITTIAVDVASGDSSEGARPAIIGAVNAVKRSANLQVIIFGSQVDLLRELHNLGCLEHPRIKRRHITETISMNDDMKTILGKTGSSLTSAIRTVERGEAQGLISSAKTQALIGLARHEFRPINRNVKPILTACIPTDIGISVAGDLGGNKKFETIDYLHAARMLTVYANKVLGYGLNNKEEYPQVGLLNMGQEEDAGDEGDRAAFRLLSQGLPNFFGNIEPNVFRRGTYLDSNGKPRKKPRILVGDGRGCNFVLKAWEGQARLDGDTVKEIFPVLKYILFWKFLKLKHDIYPPETAHAFILGVNKVAVKVHGGCDMSEAFKFAILSAQRAAENNMVDTMRTNLAT